jgi:dihydrofolate reductase
VRTLRLFMTMSCDGYFAGPDGELDWMRRTPDPEQNADVVDLISSAGTAIMGYPVASGMIPFWSRVAADPGATEADRAIAGAIAKTRAVVLSNAPVDAVLDNAEIVVARGDDEVREAVLAVKNKPGRDIGVPGGIRTARTLIRLGLVDEYVLMVHPVAIGAGQPIFTGRTDLTLTGAKTYPSGVTRLTYRPR